MSSTQIIAHKRTKVAVGLVFLAGASGVCYFTFEVVQVLVTLGVNVPDSWEVSLVLIALAMAIVGAYARSRGEIPIKTYSLKGWALSGLALVAGSGSLLLNRALTVKASSERFRFNIGAQDPIGDLGIVYDFLLFTLVSVTLAVGLGYGLAWVGKSAGFVSGTSWLVVFLSGCTALLSVAVVPLVTQGVAPLVGGFFTVTVVTVSCFYFLKRVVERELEAEKVGRSADILRLVVADYEETVRTVGLITENGVLQNSAAISMRVQSALEQDKSLDPRTILESLERLEEDALLVAGIGRAEDLTDLLKARERGLVDLGLQVDQDVWNKIDEFLQKCLVRIVSKSVTDAYSAGVSGYLDVQLSDYEGKAELLVHVTYPPGVSEEQVGSGLSAFRSALLGGIVDLYDVEYEFTEGANKAEHRLLVPLRG